MSSLIPQPHPPSPPGVARTPRRQHRGHRRRRGRQPRPATAAGSALQPSRKSSTSSTPCTATPVGGGGGGGGRYAVTMPAAKRVWNERLEAMADGLQSPKPSTPPPSQTGDAWGGGSGREHTGATSTKGCPGWWIALREGRLRDQKLHLPRGPRATRRSRTTAGTCLCCASTAARSSADSLPVVGLVVCGTGVGVGRYRRGDLGGGGTTR
ncbi:hypothetical protein DFJ73DRAFT_853226, partial [Zopfochytrium polystomum]